VVEHFHLPRERGREREEMFLVVLAWRAWRNRVMVAGLEGTNVIPSLAQYGELTRKLTGCPRNPTASSFTFIKRSSGQTKCGIINAGLAGRRLALMAEQRKGSDAGW